MKRIAGRLLAGWIAASALGCVVVQAVAQPAADYPAKPVRIVIVYAPGGGLDIVGRLVADRLTRSWERTVVVENRAGAAGNIGTEYVSRMPADGYTLLLTTNSYNINAFIYKNPGYDARKDFTPVVQLTAAPSVIVASSRSPYQSLKDVISAARAEPGKLAYASGGNGSPTHIAAEMFRTAANIELTHIPYKGGGPANQDVAAGHVPLAMAALPSAMPHVQAATLRALAVTTEKRWPTLPDVVTIAESGYPGFSHVTWIGILAPTGTPAAIIARLHKEIAAVLLTADMRERLIVIGAEASGRSPAEFEAALKAEYEATGKLVSRIGLKVD
jgi:tripartite-type tricarboxylate transporter receptor subunit TctC